MNPEILAKYPFVLMAGFLTTYLLTPVVRRLACSAGILDRPDARRIHKHPIPRGGGVAVFLGFHIACAAVFLVPWAPFKGLLDSAWWWSFLILSFLLLLVGLVDDVWSLKPWLKLGLQVTVAGLAFYFDLRVGKVLGFDLPPWLDLLATVLWFVTFINAFNLIDGIDGLASGIAAIAALGFAGSCLFRHLPGDALIILGFAGACLGFLRYNFAPATIFLGDSGSMFLGFALAAAALGTGAKGAALATLAVPLLSIGVPVFDVALAVWRRTVRHALSRQPVPEQGRSARVFQADLDHVHHRLVRSGLSQRAAASWLFALTLVLVVVGLLSMVFHSYAHGIYLLAFVAGAYVVVRHLARVELWDTGLAILAGQARVPSRTLAYVLQVPADILAMALSLAVALYCAVPYESWGVHRRLWFDELPIWVGIPFLFLFAVKAYDRVWTRARVSEFVLLVIGLAGGVLTAAGISVMMGHFNAAIRVVVLDTGTASDATVVIGQPVRQVMLFQILMHFGLSSVLVAGMRAFPSAVRDGMTWWMRSQPERSIARRRTLIYGAGRRCTLFLRAQEAGSTPQDDRAIVGLVDSDPNLRGQFVHGYRVLGTPKHIPEILVRQRVKEVLVTTPLTSDARAALLDAAAKAGAYVSVWDARVTPLTATSDSSGEHVRETE
jgi:UDP-GlcNAc:undecaprenyl-phosphate GlcNAc-1-phosphate transferase